MVAEWCPDQIWVNVVRKFDSDEDGMLGFENGEFEDLVAELLRMAGREDDENSSLAVHVTSVIASHPGFSGQRGATEASLRNAAYAGVFQDLTPVFHEWLHRNGQRYLLLLQQQQEKQKEQQSRRIVTAQRKYKAAHTPQNAPSPLQLPRNQAWGLAPSPAPGPAPLPQAPTQKQHHHPPQEHYNLPQQQQHHPQYHMQQLMRIQQLYQPENEQECQYRSMAPSLDALVRDVLARTCAPA